MSAASSGEDAQLDRLGGELAGRGQVVLVGDAHEDEEAAADGRHLAAVDADGCRLDPLYQRSHGASLAVLCGEGQTPQ